MNSICYQANKGFNFNIYTPTCDEAFKLLSNHLRGLSWYQKNGYLSRIRLFQNSPYPLIQEILKQHSFDELAGILDSMLKQKYIERFEQEIYRPAEKTYQLCQEKIQSILPDVQKVYPKIQALNKSWGFKIWPQYEIRVDPFCCGGQYWPEEKQDKGIIILGIANGIHPERIVGTMIHEMIHTGIEYLLINPNHADNPPIKHFEKERIVDHLCCYVCAEDPAWHRRYTWKDGSRHPYQEATQNYSYMDTLVGRQPDTDPLKNIQHFLEQGRKDETCRYIRKRKITR